MKKSVCLTKVMTLMFIKYCVFIFVLKSINLQLFLFSLNFLNRKWKTLNKKSFNSSVLFIISSPNIQQLVSHDRGIIYYYDYYYHFLSVLN